MKPTKEGYEAIKMKSSKEHHEHNINAINSIIESFGVGIFSYALILKLSTVYFIYGAELTLLGVIAPYYRCVWNLSNFQTSFLTSSTIIGNASGFLLWGWLSDRYGRKPILIISLFIALFFSFLSVFTPDYLWFSLARIFVGLGCASFVMPGCILTEYLPIKVRGVGLLMSMLAYNLGSIFVACMAYLLLLHDHWKWFLGVVTLPIAISILCSLTIPESVRYLANKSKTDHLRKILLQIADRHNKQLKQEELESIQPLWHQSNDESIKALFTPERRWRLLAITVILASGLISYYGFIIWNTELMQRNLSKNSQCIKLKSPQYIENIIMSFSGVVGGVIGAGLVGFIGRKVLIITSLMIMVILTLLLNIHMSSIVFSFVMFVGRAVATVSLSICNVFMNELFNTSVRAKAIGFAQSLGVLISVAAPFLIQYTARYNMLLATGTIVIGTILGIIACATQEETRNTALDVQGEWDEE